MCRDRSLIVNMEVSPEYDSISDDVSFIMGRIEAGAQKRRNLQNVLISFIKFVVSFEKFVDL